jgi:hypothetical protein
MKVQTNPRLFKRLIYRLMNEKNLLKESKVTLCKQVEKKPYKGRDSTGIELPLPILPLGERVSYSRDRVVKNNKSVNFYRNETPKSLLSDKVKTKIKYRG